MADEYIPLPLISFGGLGAYQNGAIKDDPENKFDIYSFLPLDSDEKKIINYPGCDNRKHTKEVFMCTYTSILQSQLERLCDKAKISETNPQIIEHYNEFMDQIYIIDAQLIKEQSDLFKLDYTAWLNVVDNNTRNELSEVDLDVLAKNIVTKEYLEKCRYEYFIKKVAFVVKQHLISYNAMLDNTGLDTFRFLTIDPSRVN